MELIGEMMVRKWHSDVYGAFKAAGSPYMLSTENIDLPRDYFYNGIRSADHTTVYADMMTVQGDPLIGQWTDTLGIPNNAFNMAGWFTADNDSPMGYVGTVTSVVWDDANQTATIYSADSNFYWAGDSRYNPQNYTYFSFSALPAQIYGPPYDTFYRTVGPPSWIDSHHVKVVSVGYFQGSYDQLKAGLTNGSTFKRYGSSAATQEERGTKYIAELQDFSSRTSPSGTMYNIGAHLWCWNDPAIYYWELDNFGAVTGMDNAYDGVEACFSTGNDQYGFPRLAEYRPPWIPSKACFGDFLSYVTTANNNVYVYRTGGGSETPHTGQTLLGTGHLQSGTGSFVQ
jgi:hypothetical protein